jgi:undecaprenyl-diphosphatase
MIDFFKNIDTQLFLFLNGCHNSFFDKVMWQISSIIFWVPFYMVLIGVIIYKYRQQSVYIILSLALVVLISDQLSSSVIKPLVERLRPSHDSSLEGLVHFVNEYKGGMFGFVSSHAANTFGLAMFLSLLFRNRYFSVFIFFWAALVSYSRIYLGVHYPGDIVGGAIIGIASAWFVFLLLSRIVLSKKKPQHAGHQKS